jgi:hypothetical protein
MSEVKVNKISPRSGTTVTLGDSGDTFTIPSGVTLDASSGGLAGTLTTAAQPNITSVGTLTSFTSTGIDDNATSTAITIDSSQRVGIGTASPSNTLEIAGSGTPININSTNDEVKKIQFENSGVIQGYYGCSSGTPMRILNGSSTELMRIDSSGNVGIGTNSPLDNLQVTGSGNRYIGVSCTSSGAAVLELLSSGSSEAICYSNNLRFATITGLNAAGFTERMRIDSSGNVGIGTTSPSASYGKLTVAGGMTIANDNNAKLQIGRYSVGAPNSYIKMGASSNSLRFTNPADSADLMTIDSSGNVGIGTSSITGKLNIATATSDGVNTLFGANVSPTAAGMYVGFNDSDATATLGVYYASNPYPVINITRSDRTIKFMNDALEHMRITSSGNVGIGTSSPGTALQVEKDWVSNYGSINISHSTNSLGGLGIRCNGVFKSALIYKGGTNGALLDIGTYAAEPITFRTNNAERMRIDGTGIVRMLMDNYTANPSGSNQGITFRNNGSTARTMELGISATGNATVVQFYNGNGGVGNIQLNGSATAYNTSSDYRLKENVNYDFDATTRLKQLKPARFNFIADDTKIVDGFIAHEVSSVVPEAISGEKDAVKVWQEGEELPEGVSVGDNKLDENGNTIIDTQGIDQSKLVPLLVKTIQELEARITALENA